MHAIAPPVSQPSQGGSAMPILATQTLTVDANTQGLFAEKIETVQSAWIEIQPGAVLREVK